MGDMGSLHKPALPRRRSPAARGGLLLLALGAALASALTPATTRSQSSTAVLSLCRSAVQPCQREINLLPGQTVALDLVLRDPDLNALPVAAWEVHLKLSNAGSVELVRPQASAGPVQQTGDPRLALDGLTGLTDQSSEAEAQYFTVQNRYIAQYGDLDYAVTLLGFDPARPAPRVAPLRIGDGVVLGRITLRSTASGVVDIVPGPVGRTFRMVGVPPSGALAPLELTTVAAPLARINVDPAQAPVSLQSRVEFPGWRPAAGTAARELSVTFWRTAALPPWRGGAALPVAAFDAITPDSTGAFRVGDITPAVLPTDAYQVRIKLHGALSQLAPGVVLPHASAGSLAFGVPRYGDISGDDVVDAADVVLLRAGFGRPATDAGYQDHADFNADQVVDGQDFSILALSYRQRGD